MHQNNGGGIGILGVFLMIAIFAPLFAGPALEDSSGHEYHCHLEEYEDPEKKDLHGIVVDAECRSLDPYIEEWRPFAQKANSSEWEYSNEEIAEKLDLTEGQTKYLMERMYDRGLIECANIFRTNCWYSEKYLGGEN
jgi:hypothetical protein